ncbi:MAG: demethoxyubiquinone hydroxylase family protein [Hyphomonadaceae bacterium]|jgi:ubiquinone biosynthesis monooxygenase Coq7|nr:demethoxyubiquinone hydroxylase family protein [Hyphomonadaceae bacterium]
MSASQAEPAILPPLPTRALRPASPGALSGQQKIAAMLRVDQAGEFGATRIYAGQRAVFSRLPGMRHMAATLQRQEDEEVVHKAAFDRLLAERGVRPTALSPIWGAAGFGLGVATALMGEKAAHACTVAVESVIEEHYADQLAMLGDDEPELAEMIAQFRDEEVAHKDEALAAGAEEAPGYGVLSALIKAGCRLAIATSTRV